MEDKSNSIHNYDTLSNIDLDNIANHLNIQSKGMSKINSEEFLS